MKRHFVCFMMLAIIGGAVLGDERTEAEAKALEGAWDLEVVEIMGKKIDAPKGKGGGIIFKSDGTIILKESNKPDRPGRYKIEAGTDPKQLDLIENKDGKDGILIQGIYEMDGEKLKYGFSADGPKGKRPSEFKGERVGIMYFKRQKS